MTSGARLSRLCLKRAEREKHLSRGLAREAAKNGFAVKIARPQGTFSRWTSVDLADAAGLAAEIEPRIWVENFATAEQALRGGRPAFDLL